MPTRWYAAAGLLWLKKVDCVHNFPKATCKKWHQVGRLKEAMVWIFTPNIPANTTNQDFPTCPPSRDSLPGLEGLESFYRGSGKRGSVIQSGDSGSEGKWMDLESYLQIETAADSTDRLDMGWGSQGEVRKCCKEKPILTPCWSYFFDLLFIAFVITIIYNSLPQRTLPLCLAVKLKCFCLAHREIIWPCPPVKKKRLTHPFQRLVLPRDVPQDWTPLFTLLPHCLSSILPSDFISLLLFSLGLCEKTWHPEPTRWLIWDISLPSSPSAGFPNKVVFLASTLHILDSSTSHAENSTSLKSLTREYLQVLVSMKAWASKAMFQVWLWDRECLGLRQWGDLELHTLQFSVTVVWP